MTTLKALAFMGGIMGGMVLLTIGTASGHPAAVIGLTVVALAIIVILWRRQEAAWRREEAWERRVEAESRAVLDRIARGEERTYTLAEVREMLRREGEGQ